MATKKKATKKEATKKIRWVKNATSFFPIHEVKGKKEKKGYSYAYVKGQECAIDQDDAEQAIDKGYAIPVT